MFSLFRGANHSHGFRREEDIELGHARSFQPIGISFVVA
jgi:hypothetical protein